jgi:hypothetical protein
VGVVGICFGLMFYLGKGKFVGILYWNLMILIIFDYFPERFSP